MEIRFSENIKVLRTQKGLTQKELADKLGVDQRTISAWEKGVCEPGLQMLAKICELFEEDFNSLIT